MTDTTCVVIATDESDDEIIKCYGPFETVAAAIDFAQHARDKDPAMTYETCPLRSPGKFTDEFAETD